MFRTKKLIVLSHIVLACCIVQGLMRAGRFKTVARQLMYLVSGFTWSRPLLCSYRCIGVHVLSLQLYLHYWYYS